MAIKTRMRVGDVEVEYEGAEAFLTKQMPSLIKELAHVAGGARRGAPNGGSSAVGKRTAENGDPGPLASFLNLKDAKKTQVKRFLATAEWLHRKGTNRLSTSDVSKALKQNKQNRVGNPADCLNKNVAQGYCEKDGKEFFVTDEGRNTLE